VTKTQSLVVTGFTALTVGVAIGYAGIKLGAGSDEDRPPIIVRGGSVIFESAPKNPRPAHPWMMATEGGKDVFHQDQGRPVNTLQLYFVGGIAGGSTTSAPCLPVATTSFTVSYQVGTTPATEYTVEVSKNADPAVSGSGLAPDTTSPNIVAAGNHGEGQIASVKGHDTDNVDFRCDLPAQIWIESFKKK
jgi:hypothetical protein